MSKKFNISSFLVVFCILVFFQLAQADEIHDPSTGSGLAMSEVELAGLKEQMKVMQMQMGKQAREMIRMRRKIERLEENKILAMDGAGAGQKPLALEDIFHKIEWHGEVEWEFVDTAKDDSTGEAEPHFQLDKIRLEPEIQDNRRGVRGKKQRKKN